MAPELLDSQPYNKNVDVYSFGVVMWECLTRDEPFREVLAAQIVAMSVRGERPKLPERPRAERRPRAHGVLGHAAGA